MKIILYIISFLVYFSFLIYLVRKLNSIFEKVCMCACFLLMLLGAVYHTYFYGKDVFKMVKDQEDFYFPIKERSYYKSYYGARQFLDALVHYRKNNLVYIIVYRFIKKLYGEKYFYNAFFTACLLNSMLFLFSLYLFFLILRKFHTNKIYKYIGTLIFLQPFSIIRNSIPCANSFTIFALILFLYVMVFNKNMMYKCSSLFVLYLSHKIFYACVPILFFYMFYTSNYSLFKKFWVTALLLIMGVKLVNIEPIMQEMNYKINNVYHYGNSYIPMANNKFLRFFNA